MQRAVIIIKNGKLSQPIPFHGSGEIGKGLEKKLFNLNYS
jgi:hypothetical protein